MSARGRGAIRVPDVEYFTEQVLCRQACPVHTDAGGYVRAIAEGRFEEAYRIAREPNPFASICGRICSAPCEVECRRSELDESVSIRALKRFVCERFGAESRAEESPTSGADAGPVKEQRIAVVGAGPAGLSCAHDLAAAGYGVTVFEASPRAGGMLTLGIPEYRLPRKIIEAEIGAILELGVELRTGMRLGEDFTLDELDREGFASVFLGIGAHKSRALEIEGADLDGVISAVDYLLNHHLGYRVELGPKVVVIGGGNVALDAARSALRHPESRAARLDSSDEMQVAIDVARQALRSGVREVEVYCLEDIDEMPASRHEIEDALVESVGLHPRWGPRRLLGEEGRVHGIEMVRVTSVFDSAGRFRPSFDEGTVKSVTADTVILAIGQSSDLSWVRPEDGLETTPRGTFACDPETLETSRPGVFTGGDAAFGPRNVIHAVEEGRRAARSICRHLGHSFPAAGSSYRATVLPPRQVTEGFLARSRREPPKINTERRVGVSEVEQVYAREQAEQQALRCLECHISPIFDGDRCVACGGCVDVCPEYCLSLVDSARLASQPELASLLEARYRAVPAAGSSAAILKDETRCIRCGLCAERCPVGAVTMERVEVLGG